MEPKFNLNRPKISDEEINKNKDFDNLVKQFKEQSIQKARNDVNFLKNKKATYATVIAGVAVICTVTYFTVFKNQNKTTVTNDKTTTLSTNKENNTPSLTTKKTFISPPSQKLNVPYNNYKVNAAKGGEVAHHTRSKIKVPKIAFVNKAGQDIVGDVEIQYREFHDQADIIASGIPMEYDSAGTKYTFESAGMFDVKGFQNGEEVYIKPGKTLTVEMASRQPADNYNQYYLDTVAQKWNVIKHDTPLADKRTSKAIKQDTSAASLPKTPVIQNLEKQIASIPKKVDSVKVVYTNKIEALPDPKQPAKPAKATAGRQQIELDVNYKDFPELAAFKNAVFEVGPENKNYTKEIHETTWSSATVSEGTQKGKNYIVTLKKKDRIEKIVVYPVLSGENYEQALQQYDKKFSDYNTLLAKREADEKKFRAEMEEKQNAYIESQKQMSAALLKEQIRIRQEMAQQLQDDFNSSGVVQNVVRVFTVSNFGIYNSDCPKMQPQGPSIYAIYTTPERTTPLNPSYVYLVEHGRNIVYNMSGQALRYDPSKNYSLCIVAGAKLYLCRKDEFSAVIRSAGKKFTMTPLPEGTDNVMDFKKALEI